MEENERNPFIIYVKCQDIKIFSESSQEKLKNFSPIGDIVPTTLHSMCVGEDRYWTHLPLKKTHKEKFGEVVFMIPNITNILVC